MKVIQLSSIGRALAGNSCEMEKEELGWNRRIHRWIMYPPRRTQTTLWGHLVFLLVCFVYGSGATFDRVLRGPYGV